MIYLSSVLLKYQKVAEKHYKGRRSEKQGNIVLSGADRPGNPQAGDASRALGLRITQPHGIIFLSVQLMFCKRIRTEKRRIS
jgi:hypothetical protein